MSKTAHELTRKEMKGPDRFQVAASEAASWAAARQKQIVGGVVGLLVVAALVIGITSYLDGRKTKAGGDLYRAIEVASADVSSAQLPSSDRPVYKTLEEKEKAALAEAEKVRQRHAGSRAATTALLLEGDAHLQLKEWDKAIAAYQQYLDQAPADDALRFGALDGVARAQEGKGDLAAAVKAWDKAGEIAFYKERAALEKARVLAKSGKADEARKALESLPKDSPLAGEVQARLARLGTK
jgi:tetratricopeptide (TPR) repeat protein